MTTLKDYINDFGRRVAEIESGSLEDFENAVDAYDAALEDCMDEVKSLMGIE